MPETTPPPDAAARVVLSPVVRGDGPELVAANLRNRGRHLPWIAPPIDEAGFTAWRQASLTGPHLNLLAREAPGGALVGVVSLENIVAGAFCCADLSYYGMAETGGRGLMIAAMRLALRQAFGPLGLHRLEAAVRPENAPSARLLRRLGFRFEGVSPEYIWVDGAWRDHERYALLRREFTG